ncbi:MAG: hypothetical protein A2X34_08930 [Elusimicrobia bacterium GWC2_51_8]|nr:MAG: hypothetical protein A2X33_07505 [Elusimicrobia bacterium GWA2_51_34]OGR59741.1 MAG: hypothetical protein A2X34_08930 [Elusimicrobia bacterium GWC2_51_8]HAF95857.1 hypothetical protein [Elusimicrobiota bacterium]HCE98294.1 hypothetical protein [Elusimicrobiota bacterium]
MALNTERHHSLDETRIACGSVIYHQQQGKNLYRYRQTFIRIFVYHWVGKYGRTDIEGGEMLFKKGDGGFSARSI